jgi:hypothetical protein
VLLEEGDDLPRRVIGVGMAAVVEDELHGRIGAIYLPGRFHRALLVAEGHVLVVLAGDVEHRAWLDRKSVV